MSFNQSRSFLNESRLERKTTKLATKTKNTPKKLSKQRKKSINAYDDRQRSRANRIKVSFDGHCDSLMRDPQYTNLVIPDKRRDMVSQEVQMSDKKEKTTIRYLKDRLHEEKEKRKHAEKERDILISSLNDMTVQARRLEQTLRDFEKENIELYNKHQA